jgi:hypothetical protein
MQYTQEPEPTSGSRRVNRGYALREDLIKECKVLAAQNGRKLYEVMESALEEYLERHRSQSKTKEGVQ